MEVKTGKKPVSKRHFVGLEVKEFLKNEDIEVLADCISSLSKAKKNSILHPYCPRRLLAYRDAFIYGASRWCNYSYTDIADGISCSRSTIFNSVVRTRDEVEAGEGDRVQILEALQTSVRRSLTKDTA